MSETMPESLFGMRAVSGPSGMPGHRWKSYERCVVVGPNLNPRDPAMFHVETVRGRIIDSRPDMPRVIVSVAWPSGFSTSVERESIAEAVKALAVLVREKSKQIHERGTGRP